MATAVSWLIGTVLMFLEFGVVACSALGSRRRSRYWIRLCGASLLMGALALGLAFAIVFDALPEPAYGAGWVALLFASLAVAPVFCYDTLARSDGSSDAEGGSGPGSGPPPPPPGQPHGGPPLPEADQARARRRDQHRSSLRDVSRRRPVIEPVRRRTVRR